MDASSLTDVVEVLAVDLEVDDFVVTATLSDRACWTLAEVEIGRSRTMVFSSFLHFLFSCSQLLVFLLQTSKTFYFVNFFLKPEAKNPEDLNLRTLNPKP